MKWFVTGKYFCKRTSARVPVTMGPKSEHLKFLPSSLTRQKGQRPRHGITECPQCPSSGACVKNNDWAIMCVEHKCFALLISLNHHNHCTRQLLLKFPSYSQEKGGSKIARCSGSGARTCESWASNPVVSFSSNWSVIAVLGSEWLFWKTILLITCLLSPRPIISPKLHSYSCDPNRNIFTLGSSSSRVFPPLPCNYFGSWK